MADLIWITQPLQEVSAGTPRQSIDSAIDVSGYDELFIQTYCCGVSIPSTRSVNIELITGMQNQTEDGWIQVFTNTITALTPGAAGGSFSNLVSPGTFLRYIRWNVPVGSGLPITFWMAGVARRYADQ